jgi:hypothetical protein
MKQKTFTQLRDILDQIKQVHFQAAECCAESPHADDERLNMLVDFFRQWEERLGGWLASLQEQQRQALLSTWIQYVPSDGVDQALAALRKAQPDGPASLVRSSFKLQDEIDSLLRQLADNLDASDVRELVLSLAAFERRATKELSVAGATRRDI